MYEYNFQTPVPNTEYGQQQQSKDAYEDQRHFNRSSIDAQIQVNKEIQIANAKQKIQTEAAAERNLQRCILREEISELRRGAFQEISISDTGEIFVVTKNLFKDARPRSIVNLSSPELTRYIRASKQTEIAYLLTGTVNESAESVFLDAQKIDSGTYLLRKLTACGIIFYSDKPEQKRAFAQQLLALLLQFEIPDRFVADTPGWLQLSAGVFTFVEEESLLWNQVAAMIR